MVGVMPKVRRILRLPTSMSAVDLQGHGHSPGDRGCVESYDSLLDDVEAALLEVKRTFPSSPCVLWGHSMGGDLAINYLLRRSIYLHVLLLRKYQQCACRVLR